MPIYSFKDLAPPSADASRPFAGTPVLFDPDAEDLDFVLYVEPVTPKQLADMSDEASRGGRKRNTAKFNRLLVGRVVKGWTGLAPEAVRALFGLNDAGVEAVRKQLAADGVKEIAWSRGQAEQFMDDSLAFATRVNELSSDLEVFEAASEAYDRKASRPGFTTGVAA